MQSFQLFKFFIENVHCEKCVVAVKSKIYDVLHLELEEFSKTDNLSNELVKQLSNIISVYTKNNVKNIFYVQLPLALTATDDALSVIFGSINEELTSLGYEIDNIEEIANETAKKSNYLREENPFLDKYKIWENHKNICANCTHLPDFKEEWKIDETSQENFYEIKAAISGITCSACTSTINSICKELWYIASSDVDFISKVGIFTLKSSDPEVIADLKENIEDCGYDFTLLEGPTSLFNENTVSDKTAFELFCVIDGIYCSACIHTISTAIEDSGELKNEIISYKINPITKIGNFVLKKYNAAIKDCLEETIEDCGYGFEIVGDVKKISSLAALDGTSNKVRTVSLKIDNLYCDKCPAKIEEAIKKNYDSIDSRLTFKWENPDQSDFEKNSKTLKITYLPNILQNLQIRTILKTINSIEQFHASMLEKENLQAHMNKIAEKELKSIGLRLLATFVFAIPSFIFGIVFMSLLPKNNRTKKYMEKTVIGNSTILMWILFAISTPVYFVIDFIFHKKAFKELRVLWKVNVLFNKSVSKNKSLLAKFAWRKFFKRFVKFGSMNLLISLGTSVAYFASVAMVILSTQQKPGEQMYDTYFDSVTFLTFFLLIGKFLENYSKKKTVGTLNNLASSNNNTLVQIIDQLESSDDDIKYLQIPKNQLELDDIMLIKPGESPVVDAILLKPVSAGGIHEQNQQVLTQFDESSLTGEPLPCNKRAEDPIYAGTVNLTSPVYCQITNLENLSKGSLLDKIVESITIGQLNKRASLEKTADKLTSIFVPIICFISLAVWFIWLGLGYTGRLPINYLCDNDHETCSMSWSLFSISFSISVFVISCPCALGLAVPLSIFVGSGLLAKHGILPKGGGMALQNCNNVDIVCFDKTGTLTKGEVTVVDEYIIDNKKSVDWNLVWGLENMSNHPLSFAVVAYVTKNKTCSKSFNATEVFGSIEEVAGKGLISSKGFIIGNENLLLENGYEFNEETSLKLLEWKMKGYSVINFGAHGEMILCLALADTIREESISVIENLQSRNIECYLLSGDNPLTAKAIGKQLKICNLEKNVKGGLLPQQKADIVKELSENGKKTVLMVGDGINDAPALSNATVGVAISSMNLNSQKRIGNKTSDLALISCDFAILKATNPLLSLLTLLDISEVTLHRVYMNLGWALVYNVIGIPIAAGILYGPLKFKLSPTWSAFAMAASSVSVVLSSTALKLYKPRDYEKKYGLS